MLKDFQTKHGLKRSMELIRKFDGTLNPYIFIQVSPILFIDYSVSINHST